MSQRRAAITALGTHVPARVVTNADLEKVVDTSDEWIRTRTGIHQRHVVEPGTPTSAIAALAAQDALRRGGIGAEELEPRFSSIFACSWSGWGGESRDIPPCPFP